jgi:hypothetical protein
MRPGDEALESFDRRRRRRMNRDTSYVVSDTNSEGASSTRSSRSVTMPAFSVGRPFRQSVAGVVVSVSGSVETMVSRCG